MRRNLGICRAAAGREPSKKKATPKPSAKDLGAHACSVLEFDVRHVAIMRSVQFSPFHASQIRPRQLLLSCCPVCSPPLVSTRPGQVFRANILARCCTWHMLRNMHLLTYIHMSSDCLTARAGALTAKDTLEGQERNPRSREQVRPCSLMSPKGVS